MSQEVVDYQYCTEVPFRDFEYCYNELTVVQLDQLMFTISIVVVSLFVLAIAVRRHCVK